MTESNAIALVEEQSPAGLSMIDGPDPQAAMHYAAEVSKAITSVLKPGNGYVEMQGRKHIEAAGWQTIAAMTGHTCEVEYSRMVEGLEDGGLHAWEARAIVRDQNGRIVSSGESMASPTERVKRRDGSVAPPPWSREEFSIRSMAQTRAMGRAMAARMRYVVQLAGFQGAPAEEMPAAPAQAAEPLWKRRYDDLLLLAEAEGMDEKGLKAILKGLGMKGAKDLDDEDLNVKAIRAVCEPKDEPLDGEVVDEPTGDASVAEPIPFPGPDAEDNPRSAPGDA